jgi:uncharacterized protein (TIGR02300 family)
MRRRHDPAPYQGEAFDSTPVKWQGSRLSRFLEAPLADAALGSKHICPNCQAKFYDLNRRPAHCPKCDTEFDPEEAVKFRRIRARSAGPNYEDEQEAEDQVKAGGDEEQEDEDHGAPEIDEGAEEDVVPGDEEEIEPAAAEEAPGGDVEIEEDVDLEEDDAVPFLEEDEEGFEEDIEGLPEEGDEDH